MKALLLMLLALVMAPAASSSSTPSASAHSRARIMILDQSPLVVRGVGFKADERVTVSVAHAKTLFRRQAVAGSTGVVMARWTRSMPATCGSTTITAVGSKGTRVAFKSVANDCAPGPNDPIQVDDPRSIEPPLLYPVDPQPKRRP